MVVKCLGGIDLGVGVPYDCLCVVLWIVTLDTILQEYDHAFHA